MIKFDKPKNLNGQELILELKEVGVKINELTSPLIDGKGDFYLDIIEGEIEVANKIIANHNGTTTKPDITEQKALLLNKLGITAEEAKLLLA